MMSLTATLSQMFGDAFASQGLDTSYGTVVVSARPDLAQFQCNGAMAAAKQAKKNPREVAQSVIDNLVDKTPFAELGLAGPGFVNITLTDEYLAEYIDSLDEESKFGTLTDEPKKIVVDYGGPNVAKELHVGHLRPAIIGESVKQTLRYLGNDVVGDVHLGDWGMPYGQLIADLEDRFPDWPYFDESKTDGYPETSPLAIEDLQVLYPQAALRAKEDEDFAARARAAVVELQAGRPGYRALWQHMRDISIAAMKKVYDRLNVHFELWYGESTINHRLKPMVKRVSDSGDAYESDGALVIEVMTDEDTKEIPPLLVLKSDGASLYTTWDLATIEDRVEEFGAEEILYFVDVRQGLHFEQVFRAAHKTGIAPPEVVLEHPGNGTVNGPDGKPFKTRDGGLLTLRELIDMVVERAAQRIEENALAAEFDDEEKGEIAEMVGVAALKYGDLQNHRSSNYIFDVDRFTSFDGKTGPYLLYGAVRMQSVLREAGGRGLAAGTVIAPTVDQERNLMLQLARLPEVVARTAEHRAPNHIAEYAYELVADFSRFYEVCHILREEDQARQASWLHLIELALAELRLLLSLLAIDVPERM
ncbi:MAG: arginine--tRNA ligase [bacterium]|nr:arginine--tRNA ligase [bacterium]MCP4963838.1 arginine--tRNA ligase [bacterium]